LNSYRTCISLIRDILKESRS